MTPRSSLPRFALEAGMGGRYRYWVGTSGRRYLCTAVDPRSLEDFAEGLVIAVRGGSVIWAGGLSAWRDRPATAWLSGAETYLHLLAATDAERRAAAADLRPPERAAPRLAA